MNHLINNFTVRVKRHDSFITILKEQPCGQVQTLNFDERCDFIKNTTGCHEAVNYIDYLNFIYCTIGTYSEHAFIGGVLLACILCVYLFIVLGTTADKFFCPALAVISKILKMSENLAGVTILAFGNGSPDIFTSVSNTDGDTELLYCELIGAAAFVTGLIAGVIILLKPFQLVGRNYIRDVAFFLLAAIYIQLSISDQKYTIFEGVVTIFIYILYLMVVIVDHIYMKRTVQKIRKMTIDYTNRLTNVSEILKRADDFEEMTEIKIHNRKDSSVIMDEEILSTIYQEVTGLPNRNLFKTFVKSLNPIDDEDWHKAKVIGKLFMILKIPVLMFLLLVIPIVDYGEDLHGWSKLLNIFHLFSLPVVVLMATGNITTSLFGAPLYGLVLVVSCGLSVVIFMTSRNDRPPRYHQAYAIGSFIGSIVVIYTVAQEVVSVLNALGIISDLTDSMLGLSILAWGNSIGDLFSNIALAKQGYQQMAFAACFGGPMFNSLLGTGLTFLLKAGKSVNNIAFVREGAMGPNCILFLIFILSFTMLAFSFTKFRARKSIGIYMLIIYFLFIFYSFMGELEYIHPYGTDHQV